MNIEVKSVDEMLRFGVLLGQNVHGGEVIELVGDIGAGKTVLTKGIATGMGVADLVQSPTFAISSVYEATDDLRLAHYDFYRLTDPGIMADELHENIDDEKTVTIVEWGEIVEGVLPEDRIKIKINSISENTRQISMTANDDFIERISQ